MNTALEYSTRVVQEGDRRCKKSTLNDLAYLTPLRIPLMNPVYVYPLRRELRCPLRPLPGETSEKKLPVLSHIALLLFSLVQTYSTFTL
jgi:hypothetical protein